MSKTETRQAKLSQATAKIDLPEGVDDLIVRDTELSGFQLRIRKASRRWLFSGRIKRGDRRTVTLGDAAAMTAVQARALAQETRTAFLQGRDLVAEAEAAAAKAKAGKTFNEVADDYLKLWAAGKLGNLPPRPASIATQPVTLLRARAAFGAKDIKTIAPADLRGFLNSLNEDATSKLSGGKIAGATALKNWVTTAAVFKFAFGRGLIDVNPALGFGKPQAAGPRDRVLTPDEIKAVWLACEGLGRWGQLVRFLMAVPLRLSLARLADWQQISLTEKTFTIAAEARGNKAAKSMVIPLTDTACEVLERLPFRAGAVFVSRAGRPCGFGDREKAALDEASGVTNWRLHDLRRTAATTTGNAADGAIDIDAFELWLQHSRGGIVGVYQQATRLKAQRVCAAQWNATLRQIVGLDPAIAPAEPPAALIEPPTVAPTATNVVSLFPKKGAAA